MPGVVPAGTHSKWLEGTINRGVRCSRRGADRVPAGPSNANHDSDGVLVDAVAGRVEDKGVGNQQCNEVDDLHQQLQLDQDRDPSPPVFPASTSTQTSKQVNK